MILTDLDYLDLNAPEDGMFDNADEDELVPYYQDIFICYSRTLS